MIKQFSTKIRRYVLATLLALSVFGISPSVSLASTNTSTVDAPTEQVANSPAPAQAAAMLQRLAAAEAALHRGQFEATVTNAEGSGAWARLRFDLGDAIQPPAFHITSVMTTNFVVQTTERITIGDRSWERQPNGSWSARP